MKTLSTTWKVLRKLVHEYETRGAELGMEGQSSMSTNQLFIDLRKLVHEYQTLLSVVKFEVRETELASRPPWK